MSLDPTAATPTSLGSFERYMEHLSAAFAVTRGEKHILVYANIAFQELLTVSGTLPLGSPIRGVFSEQDASVFIPLLDRAFRTGVVSRNRRMVAADDEKQSLRCTVWPDVTPSGEADHLLIEIRAPASGELSLALQRAVAERLLLSALREYDAAALAHAAWRRSAFLADEIRRLSVSLDEDTTIAAIERMSLPPLGAWCIVDILDAKKTMRRLAIVHPDPERQDILRTLDGQWLPEDRDSYGLPAVMRNGGTPALVENAEEAFAASSCSDVICGPLRTVGIGQLLTVPLVAEEKLLGALTFVGDRGGALVTAESLALAKELASQSAMALERAREHGEALALRRRAEAANEAKSTFLGMMSHELRTPLTAIAGYVDLIDMELRGPVTSQQRADLDRIRINQRYLTGLINDLLNLTAIDSGSVVYDLNDMSAIDVLTSAVVMLEPLFKKNGLLFEGISCSPSIVLRADRDKVLQILLNLLTNSIKYTPRGGHVRIQAEDLTDAVKLNVIDTGVGITPDNLGRIFEPFVQIRKELTAPHGGIGLGLGISRGLARAMRGDLTVESISGAGSTFTLTLPRGDDQSFGTKSTNYEVAERRDASLSG